MSRVYAFIVLLIPAIVFSTELIINGDFEDTTGTGWDTVCFGGQKISLNFSKDYDPDDDYECDLKYWGATEGAVRLFQTVDVQNKDLKCLNFSMNALLMAYGAEGWAIAAMVISYLNSEGERLGDTKFYTFSSISPITEDSIAWLHDPNQSVYKVYDTLWHSYSFNVLEELQKIATINPSDVGKIEVAAIDTCGAYG